MLGVSGIVVQLIRGTLTRISLAILSRFFNCGSVRSKSVLGGLHHEYSLCPA